MNSPRYQYPGQRRAQDAVYARLESLFCRLPIPLKAESRRTPRAMFPHWNAPNSNPQKFPRLLPPIGMPQELSLSVCRPEPAPVETVTTVPCFASASAPTMDSLKVEGLELAFSERRQAIKDPSCPSQAFHCHCKALQSLIAVLRLVEERLQVELLQLWRAVTVQGHQWQLDCSSRQCAPVLCRPVTEASALRQSMSHDIPGEEDERGEEDAAGGGYRELG